MLKIYGPFAENIRSFGVKYTVPKNHIWVINGRQNAENIRSWSWIYTVPKNHILVIYEQKCAENIRSSSWKYTVPKNHKWDTNDRRYTLKIYGPWKFYVRTEYQKIYSPYAENIRSPNCIYTVLKLFKAWKSGKYTVRMFGLRVRLSYKFGLGWVTNLG